MKYVQIVVPSETWAKFKYMAARENLTASEKLLRMITREAHGQYETESKSMEEGGK